MKNMQNADNVHKRGCARDVQLFNKALFLIICPLTKVWCLTSGVGQQDLADREELHVLPGDGGEGGHGGALLSQGGLR